MNTFSKNDVSISTRNFELSHGKKPSGFGNWAFEIRGHEGVFWHRGKYSEAKKAAVARAFELGTFNINVGS